MAQKFWDAAKPRGRVMVYFCPGTSVPPVSHTIVICMDRVPNLRDRDTELAQARLGLQAAYSTLQDGNPVAALQVSRHPFQINVIPLL